jgi:uncharacterized protein YcbK (DUF882 family)
MGDLTRNFSRKEFECKCGCGFNTIDYELICILQNDLIQHFEIKYECKISVIITSGDRCVNHNEEVQKEYNSDYVPFSSKSQHIFARAADFKVYKVYENNKIQIDPKEIYEYLDKRYPNKYGLGLYYNRNHLDTRSGSGKRWKKI